MAKEIDIRIKKYDDNVSIWLRRNIDCCDYHALIVAKDKNRLILVYNKMNEVITQMRKSYPQIDYLDITAPVVTFWWQRVLLHYYKTTLRPFTSAAIKKQCTEVLNEIFFESGELLRDIVINLAEEYMKSNAE